MKIYHYFDEFSPEIKKISKIVTDPDRICYLYEEKSLKRIFECCDTDTLYYDGNVSLTTLQVSCYRSCRYGGIQFRY